MTSPEQHRRSFGAAVQPKHLKPGTEIASLVTRRCNFLVPEYHCQWSAIEWQRGNRWFGNLDPIVEFASNNFMKVRGHSLIWEQMTPDWARTAMLDDRDWGIVQTHFAAMLTRYDRTMSEWVVVNEPIDTEGGDQDMRRTSFQRAFGNTYVKRALETARAIAPHTRLILNEYGLEYDNPVDEARRSALLRLVEHLRHTGAPLDGVGIQAHLELAKGRLPVQKLERFFHDLAGLGVDISITELDVLEDDRSAPVAVRDQRVADGARAFLDLVLGQPGIRDIATWGLSDRDSWLQGRAAATKDASSCTPVDCVSMNRGLPYDGDLAPKPMLSTLMIEDA